MGDRATVKLHSKQELTASTRASVISAPLSIYVHWHGSSLRKYVAEAIKEYRDRADDHSYFIRCIIHHISTKVGGLPTGMGVGMSEYENEYDSLDVFLDTKEVKDGSDIYTYAEFVTITLK